MWRPEVGVNTSMDDLDEHLLLGKIFCFVDLVKCRCFAAAAAVLNTNIIAVRHSP